MPRGNKESDSPKKTRQAHHIEQSYEDKERNKEDAERIAWSTVIKKSERQKKQ